MTKSFKNIADADARAFIVEHLCNNTLLGRRGNTLHESVYILSYDPAQQAQASQLIDAICKTDLPVHNVAPHIIDLYDIVLRYLDENDIWEPLCEAEATLAREDIITTLQDTVSVNDVVAPAVNAEISNNPRADIFFITGVGETYPYVRTHALLTALKSTKPVVLVFPGRFERHVDGSTTLAILDIKQEQSGGYYRATNLFDL